MLRFAAPARARAKKKCDGEREPIDLRPIELGEGDERLLHLPPPPKGTYEAAIALARSWLADGITAHRRAIPAGSVFTICRAQDGRLASLVLDQFPTADAALAVAGSVVFGAAQAYIDTHARWGQEAVAKRAEAARRSEMSPGPPPAVPEGCRRYVDLAPAPLGTAPETIAEARRWAKAGVFAEKVERPTGGTETRLKRWRFERGQWREALVTADAFANVGKAFAEVDRLIFTLVADSLKRRAQPVPEMSADERRSQIALIVDARSMIAVERAKEHVDQDRIDRLDRCIADAERRLEMDEDDRSY